MVSKVAIIDVLLFGTEKPPLACIVTFEDCEYLVRFPKTLSI